MVFPVDGLGKETMNKTEIITALEEMIAGMEQAMNHNQIPGSDNEKWYCKGYNRAISDHLLILQGIVNCLYGEELPHKVVAIDKIRG